MNKILISLTLLLTTLFVYGCGDDEKIYTVDEIKGNIELKNEIMSKCLNGEKINPQNCDNALDAR